MPGLRRSRGIGCIHRFIAADVGLGILVFRIALELALELPVGIVTAVIGGPFFLWLLVRRT